MYPFPRPDQLRAMIKQKAKDVGLHFNSPEEMTSFVNQRAQAAQEQYALGMAEVPEEEIRVRNRMQREDPAFGASQWFVQYESRIGEIAIAQALEFGSDAAHP